MKIANFTPHPVALYGKNTVREGPQLVIPVSGKIARVVTIELGTSQVGGFNMPPITYEMVEYGHLEGLSPPVPGTWYVVSLVAALAARGRDDILAPYLEVRNDEGTVIGCRYLQKVC